MSYLLGLHVPLSVGAKLHILGLATLVYATEIPMTTKPRYAWKR
jgi:hypothetical protein